MFHRYLQTVDLGAMVSLRLCDNGDVRFGSNDPRRWMRRLPKGIVSLDAALLAEYATPEPTKIIATSITNGGNRELIPIGMGAAELIYGVGPNSQMVRVKVTTGGKSLYRLTFKYTDLDNHCTVSEADQTIQWMATKAPLIKTWNKVKKDYCVVS